MDPSIWIPLVAAALGASGQILAAWITSRRTGPAVPPGPRS